MPTRKRSSGSFGIQLKNLIPGWRAASRLRGGFDITLLTLVLILLSLGLLMVLSSSYPRAYSQALANDSGSPLDYFNHQLMFAIAGVVIMYAASWIPMSLYRQSSRLVYLFAAVMLLLVLVMGAAENNARRWISLGPLSFQPSEITKLAIILVFADLIAKYRARMETIQYGVVPFAVMLGVPIVLLFFEPHISCILIISLIGLTMMVIGGMPRKYFFIGLAVVAALGTLAFFVSTHVHVRILAWLFPSRYADDDITYQVRESLMAIGSGGLTGLGPGEGRQKYLYLPESHNDYIFSIVCEELGLIGAAAIILLLALMLLRCTQITLHTQDRFSFLVAAGITAHFGLQTILNIAVVTNSLPCTGVSLPFFSYGGTALLMQLLEMGILLSISREAPLSRAG